MSEVGRIAFAPHYGDPEIPPFPGAQWDLARGAWIDPATTRAAADDPVWSPSAEPPFAVVAPPSGSKATNPKDAVGVRKVPFSTVPASVVAEIGLAMLEGARKYGRHNYRKAGVRASVYYDASLRHMTAWWEGEDIDAESGLSHITKALACLVVIRDSMIQGNWKDDRPPATPAGWIGRLNEAAGVIIDRHPNPKEAHVAKPENQ